MREQCHYIISRRLWRTDRTPRMSYELSSGDTSWQAATWKIQKIMRLILKLVLKV
jgi:hypothetical protein